MTIERNFDPAGDIGRMVNRTLQVQAEASAASRVWKFDAAVGQNHVSPVVMADETVDSC